MAKTGFAALAAYVRHQQVATVSVNDETIDVGVVPLSLSEFEFIREQCKDKPENVAPSIIAASAYLAEHAGLPLTPEVLRAFDHLPWAIVSPLSSQVMKISGFDMSQAEAEKN